MTVILIKKGTYEGHKIEMLTFVVECSEYRTFPYTSLGPHGASCLRGELDTAQN